MSNWDDFIKRYLPDGEKEETRQSAEKAGGMGYDDFIAAYAPQNTSRAVDGANPYEQSATQEEPFQLRMAKKYASGELKSTGQKRQEQQDADKAFRSSLWNALGLAAESAQRANSGVWESPQDSVDRARAQMQAASDVAAAKKASDEAAAAFDRQTTGQRAAKVLAGWGGRAFGNIGNALLTVGKAYGEGKAISNAYSDSAMLTNAMLGLDPVAEAQKVRDAIQSEQAQQQWDEYRKPFDEAAMQGNEYVQQAKDGAGALGRLAVDAGVGLADLAADQALNAIVPGSGMAAMATRVFGEAAREERLAGGSDAQQMLAGTKAAAIEVLTEKIAGIGGVKGVKPGLIDGLMDKALDRFVANGGSAILGKVVQAFGSEAAEEMISDLLNPIADWALGLKGSWSEAWSDTTAEGVLYDGLLGGLLGMLGGVGEGVQYNRERTMAQAVAAAEQAMRHGMQQNVTQEAAGERETQGDIPAPPAGKNASMDDSERLNRTAVTEGKAEAAGQDDLLDEPDDFYWESSKTEPAAGQEKTAPEGADGLETYSEQEANNLLASHKNKVVGFGATIRDFVKQAIATKGQGGRLYLGKLPKRTVDMVRSSTGLNVDGYSSIMNGSEAWHAFRSHSDAAKEAARGQVALTEADFDLLPRVLAAPDSVTLSPELDGNGRPAIIFTKRIGNEYVTVQGYSSGKKGLSFDSMYIKRGSLPARQMQANLPAQDITPIASAGTASSRGEVQTADAEASRFTSETKNAQSPAEMEESTSTSTIAPAEEDVNGEARDAAQTAVTEPTGRGSERSLAMETGRDEAVVDMDSNTQQEPTPPKEAEPSNQIMERIYGLIPELRQSQAKEKAKAPKSVYEIIDDLVRKNTHPKAEITDPTEFIMTAATRPARVRYFGEELYSKLDRTGKALSKSTASNPGGIGSSFRAWINGQKTAEELARDYHALKKQDGGYYFDQSVAERMEELAEAEQRGELLDSSGGIRPEYSQRIEQIAAQLEHRTLRQAEKMEQRKALEKELRAAAPEIKRGGSGTLSSAAKWYSRIQSRPDTLFAFLAGFDRRNGKNLYKLAEKSRKVVLDKINTHQAAESFFTDSVGMEGYKDFAQGRSNVANIIPGLDSYGVNISNNYVLGLLKLLETDGAIAHIIENGTQFANSEKELYSGRNNSGFGDVKGYAQAVPLISEQTRERLLMAQTEEERAGAKKAAANELEILAGKLHQYVEADPVMKSLYNASFRAMDYLKGKINETSRVMYGTDFANQDSSYWPMEIADWRGGSGEWLNDQRAGLKDASIVQKRTGPGGALRVRPFTDVMSRYIDRASDWAAYAEFSDELELLSKNAGEQSAPLAALIGDTFGKGYKKWLDTYTSELNGQGGDGISSTLGKLRSNIAQSSLLLNGGVALKQTPSYFDFGGEIDLDILAKHIPGMLMPAKSFDKNEIVKEIDQRSGLLGSRRMGYNNVEMGETTDAARSLGKNFADRLPGWLTNWINKSDYRTVSNGLLACADQVKRDHPEVKANSPEFFDLVTEKFETAVMRSQPIYNRQYRAEYLRSRNEWVRMFSMFRTQQTQNFNQLLTAAGEYQAAKRTGSADDVQQAKKKLRGVVSGQIAGAVVYAILTGAARALIHKNDDFENENGEWKIDKIADRLGLNLIGTIAGTTWFGDTLSAVLVDTISNAATGGKGSSEFYDFEESVSGMLADLGSGIISFAKKPNLKNGRNLIFSISQACGIPTRNVYNMVNSVLMYSLDAAGRNPGSYDDAVNMIQSHWNMTTKQRATETAKAAMNYYRTGRDKQADALLSTLDIDGPYVDTPDVVEAIKKTAEEALGDGQISAEQYRKTLQDYCGMDNKSIKKQWKRGSFSSEDAMTALQEAGGLSESEARAEVTLWEADTDGKSGTTQKEVWAWYQAHPDQENLVKTMWEARGWKTDWETFKSKHK